MGKRRRLRLGTACALLVATTCGSSALIEPRASVAPAATPSKPNLVLILTDDQRWDQLGFMPTVQSELVGKA